MAKIISMARQELLRITERLHYPETLDELVSDAIRDMVSLLEVERLNIYFFDWDKDELVSRHNTSNKEIRVHVSGNSLLWYCVRENKVVSVKDIYDEKELAAIDPKLKHDRSQDIEGFKTRSVLVAPINFQDKWLGVIEFINRKDVSAFTEEDRRALTDLSEMLSGPLFRLRKKEKNRAKFKYLLENHILSYEDLDAAVSLTIKERKPKHCFSCGHKNPGHAQFCEECNAAIRLKASERAEEDVETVLMESFDVSKEDLVEALSRFFKVPYEKYDPRAPVPDEELFPKNFEVMREKVFVPLRKENDKVIIAIDNPHDLPRIGDIRDIYLFYTRVKGLQFQNLEFHFALKKDISMFLNRFEETLYHMTEMDEMTASTISRVDNIMLSAHLANASHIYFEPSLGEDTVRIRFREDGVHRDAYRGTISYSDMKTIISHLKSMSDKEEESDLRNAFQNIVSRQKVLWDRDVKEHGIYQEVIKYKCRILKKHIKIQMVTLPTADGGTSMTLRILDADTIILPLGIPKLIKRSSKQLKQAIHPLEALGLSHPNLQVLKQILSMPSGLFLVAGCQDCEMNAALHSLLKFMNTKERRIVTIEDSMRLPHPGLTQIQVNSLIGFDFVKALDAVLRVDPDVVMVERMQDLSTVSKVLRASSSSLVLSSVPCKNGLEAVEFLIEMGINSVQLADALLGVLTQGSVRVLCSECKTPYHPSEQEFKAFTKEYGEKGCAKHGIAYSPDMVFYKAKGCDKCHKAGYKGQASVHELLLATDEMKSLMREHASFEEAFAKTKSETMYTLKQDAMQKALQGITDLTQALNSSPLRVYHQAEVKDQLKVKRVIGRYEILEEIGKGGLGICYKAMDTKNKRVVFIKAVVSLGEEEEIEPLKSDLFATEKETISKLSHPGIVKTYDAGKGYMAMEFLDGESLEKYCEKGSLLPLKKILGVIAETADALEHVHSKGLIHGAIEPKNIMLLKNGKIKVRHFLTAGLISPNKNNFHTRVAGCEHEYMSPEYLEGPKIDGRTDVFSLGIVFFQLLTGELPFKVDFEEEPVVGFGQITQKRHPSVRDLNPKIPAVVEWAIDKALAKEPSKRYQTAGEIAEHLRKVMEQVG